jgi:hypothetical protein
MKRYDATRPPEQPEGVHTTQYYFPPQKKPGVSIPFRGPDFNEAPCMALHYDKDGNLLLTRFIFSDGTYKDAT